MAALRPSSTYFVSFPHVRRPYWCECLALFPHFFPLNLLMQHVCQASCDAATREYLQRPCFEVKNKTQHDKPTLAPLITESALLLPLSWNRRRRKRPRARRLCSLPRIPTRGLPRQRGGVHVEACDLWAWASASPSECVDHH